MTRIAVIYYSATGNVHALAEAIAEGARSADAEVRLKRVPELARDEAIDVNPAWRRHLDQARLTVPEATLADLEWADGYAFGTPTRYGAVAAQLKQFLDHTVGLWQKSLLVDKTRGDHRSASRRVSGSSLRSRLTSSPAAPLVVKLALPQLGR